MTLKQIEAHNFKSFRDLSVELGQLNVLIGANASGKSNFAQLLRFLRDLMVSGLRNAVSIQGGSEYLLNLKLGQLEPFSVGLVFADTGPLRYVGTTMDGYSVDMPLPAIAYEFALTVSPSKGDIVVLRDRANVKGELWRTSHSSHEVEESLGIGEIVLDNQRTRVVYTVTSSTGDKIKPVFASYVSRESFTLEGLIFENLSSMPFVLPEALTELLPQISIFDINAKLLKQVAPTTGKIDLEEDGSNLVIALKNILEDEDKRRTFSNLLQDILPFVSDIDVQRFADRFLHFRLRETYSGGQFLPASLMSDGTVNITALIVALYFSDKPLIVIEEPEKNIHPYLIARVANMLKDASRHKQIIVTTHNPEIVKNVALDDLLLVSRDRDGFSTIRRPAEDKDVQTFLSNEIGIDELFARNLLGA